MKMFQQNQKVFLLLLETADCKGSQLSNEGQSSRRGLILCLRDGEAFDAAIAFLGLWIPQALLCS